jgi:hypothetical protein
MFSTELPGESMNNAADYWYYDIGVNVIPADTRNKVTNIQWTEYQDNPVSVEQFNKWKSNKHFNKGIGIILGKVWHNEQKKGLYLVGIDCDNSKAIEEICCRNGKTISLSELAQWTVVEQHLDDVTKAHILVYSHKPYPKKSSNKTNSNMISKIDGNESPALEVKSLGSHGILFVSPSIHEKGEPYQIIGTKEPIISDDFDEHIDNICRKYSISYLDRNGRSNGLQPIQELFKTDFKIFEGHNRHEALMRVMESLIVRNSSILSQEQIKTLTHQWNDLHCSPPLDNTEFERQWKCAATFIAKKDISNCEESREEQQLNEDEKLAKIRLMKDDIDFAINTIIKEAKYDELSIRQIIHGFNSTFTKLPIPHIINSKNSGAGKSYILNHVAQFYPDKCIITLAGLSDKAIFHSDGPMVIEDENTGEIKLLDFSISELESEIEWLEEDDVKKNKQNIKVIQSEIKSLQRSAQKLIDLNNKIIIVQDTPQPAVFNLLMTLLSQDSPKDQLYAFTDKASGSGKLIQSKNRIRGMPVIFTTQVVDDTDNQRFEEKNRRFIHVTPNTSKEKIKEANRLTAFKYGYLKEEYDRLVVNRADIVRTKNIIRIIIAKLKQHTKYLVPKDTGVKIPYALTIEESLPDDGRVWQMTVGERLMKYLSMNTKLHMDSRPKLVNKKTGAFYPISTFEDLRDCLVLMERAAINMRPYLADWYDRVFLKAIRELNGEPKIIQNDLGIIYMKESSVGLTTEELAIKTKEMMQVSKPSTEEIRERYLNPLINHGLIDKTASTRDNRQNIYYPVEYSAKSMSDTSDSKNKVVVRDPTLYPTKDVLIESFETLIEYPANDTKILENISQYRIIDVDGTQLGLDELVDRYFCNPEQYFEMGFTSEEGEIEILRKKIFFTCRQRAILQSFSQNVIEEGTNAIRD